MKKKEKSKENIIFAWEVAGGSQKHRAFAKRPIAQITITNL
jgi:hypothetical protein